MIRETSFSRRRLFQVAVLPMVLGLGLVASAAAQTTSGAISGVVADQQGGALPGVSLATRNTDTGVTRTIVSEADGLYRFAALPPGRYDLTAQLAGFATVEVRGLTLTIGLELQRNLTMALQSLQETVTVAGQVPVVETTRSEVAGVVTQQQIDSLPISGRQPVALALLMPGTNQDAVRPRKFNANIGAGSTYQSATYLVDGTWNQEATQGEPRQDFPQAAIREFKINVSQATAEYGNTTGGVVTIVTKSGTNSFNGEAFEFFRDKSINTMNRFEEASGNPKPDFRRHQFGGAFGGPIVKNRVHYYLAAERTDQQQFFTVTSGKPAFYSALEGTFPNPYTNNAFFLRGDGQLTPQQTLFVRYAYQEDNIYCETCGGNSAAFSGTGSLTQTRHGLVVGHTWVLGAHAVNEFRFQRASYFFVRSAPGTPPWTQVGQFPAERLTGRTAVYNFPSMTWGSSANALVDETIKEYRDDFSIITNWHGSHTWKFGAAFIDFPMLIDVPVSLGTWTFATDQPFNPANPTSLANLKSPTLFAITAPPITTPLPNQLYQAYVQDEWRPRPDLTLNLGVRYDVQKKGFNEGMDLSLFPRPVPFIDPTSRGDMNNVGPRAGFAWDVRNDGKTVVRGGYGLYYQAGFGMGRAELTNLRQANISIRNPAYPDPYQGRDPLTFASTAPQNISIVDNKIQNAQAYAVNAGISYGLTPLVGIHIDGIYTRTSKIPLPININQADPITGRRPLPEFSRILQTQSIGVTDFRSLMVRLNRQFANHYQYLVSYTLGRTLNNLPYQGATPGTQITDGLNPGLDLGPALGDRRHALIASGAVLLPHDVTLGAVWSLRSTMAFSALAGLDLNGDGAVTDYVPGTTRNQGNRSLDVNLVNAWRAANGRAPISASQFDSNRYNAMDVRVSKGFRLGGSRRAELIGQVFNVLGTDNLLASAGSTWVTNALSDSFGRVLQASNRQQAELAVRMVW